MHKNGAGDGIRTRDNHLGKVALYQLSYSRSILYLVPEAGLEPARDRISRDFKSLVSTNSTTPARLFLISGGDTRIRTGDGDFADLCLTTWRCRLLWSGRRDSNPRQPPWQGGALPAELLPLTCEIKVSNSCYLVNDIF